VAERVADIARLLLQRGAISRESRDANWPHASDTTFQLDGA
jgi:hypothetical protein